MKHGKHLGVDGFLWLTWLTASAIGLLSGCSVGTDGTDLEQSTARESSDAPAVGTPSSSQETTSTISGDHPAPRVQTKLEDGIAIEVYDLGARALVLAIGNAQTTTPKRVAKAFGKNTSFGAGFSSLGLEVPTELAQIDAKYQRAHATPHVPRARLMASGPSSGPSSDASGSAGGSKSSTGGPGLLDPCGNNCCNVDWLYTNMCNGTGDQVWDLYFYDWSWQGNSVVDEYYGAVCAGIGTSVFTLDVGSRGGTWWIPENNWVWYHYTDGCYLGLCAADTSQVNDSSDPHLHTYCGYVNN